ncbi:hypothetical protein NFI96_000836 [Prochilodus magdalenae]|nr:hypothetical protein NFI96_000836 [Prochilodus magdalenae]
MSDGSGGAECWIVDCQQENHLVMAKHDAGHQLFDLACEHLGIVEKHYFSLQISEDTSSSPRWLDPNKPFKKQLKGTDPFYLIFRVRFFISDPNTLQHEQTRLKCPLSSAVVLASYAVQSECGDFVPETPAGYLGQMLFIPEQDKDFLIKVESLHPQHKGLSQSEAELCYLNTARTLDLYGVELHSARDANNPSLWVGIASGGVAMFCNLVCSSFFPWINIIKISFKRKRFFIHLGRKHGEVGQQVVSVSMPSSRASKNLWRSCVDHHTFYNRKNPLAVSKPRTVPLYRKLIGDVMWNPIIRRSPRLRHDFRKPRPSSVDNLTNEMSYVTESEDVFYTYRKAQEDEKTSSVPCQTDELATGDEEDWQCLWDKNMAADGELLLVRISPDQDGKFGFNVKGGVDQKMPLAISHVNPNSPAGRCVPALLEGDQVLLINGRDISEHTHQQVVMFIKASRESHSKELALLVRRKGVSLRVETPLQLGGGLNLQEEMPSPVSHPSGETLEESMARLERGLNSGTLLMQFETEPAGTVLQYVAAQGPLPHTCTHFWRSVWEQGVTVIIMLTTLTERGRTKCHQYWPHPPEVKDYEHLQVCCHSEECNLAYVTRELTLTNTQLGQHRSITHLQYVAWPDHGVPEESSDFLDFVQAMRSKRTATEALLVHCSAGIGRTGVLITMETALILMENAKPVYPLEIVTSLREQRAMMVQTSVLALIHTQKD